MCCFNLTHLLDLEDVEGAGLEEEELEEPGDDWDTCSSDEEDGRSSEGQYY